MPFVVAQKGLMSPKAYFVVLLSGTMLASAQFSSSESLYPLISQGGNAGNVTIIYARRWVYIDSEDQSGVVGSRRFYSRSRISFWPDPSEPDMFEIPPSGFRIYGKSILDGGWYMMELVVSTRHRFSYPPRQLDDPIHSTIPGEDNLDESPWEFTGLWEGTVRLVE